MVSLQLPAGDKTMLRRSNPVAHIAATPANERPGKRFRLRQALYGSPAEIRSLTLDSGRPSAAAFANDARPFTNRELDQFRGVDLRSITDMLGHHDEERSNRDAREAC
jgi:hypothetical protein